MKIVFMGSPDFAVPSLKRLIDDGNEVVSVYTQPDKPAGRGCTLHISPVKAFANEIQVPIEQPLTLKDPVVQDKLRAYNPDLIILVAYGLFLPKEVLTIPKYGCLNIHPSLLPRHRGAAPVISTLLSGDKWAGVSLMKMDDGWDTGDLLASASVLVRDDDTYVSLMNKISLIGAYLLSDNVNLWTQGRLRAKPQDSTQATYIKMLKKEDGLIDWSLPALNIWNRVRALNPWPGTFTFENGKLIKILSAHVVHYDIEDKNPGKVIKTKNYVDVVTGFGLLRLDTIQPEGKKAMLAVDYGRGNGFQSDVILSSN